MYVVVFKCFNPFPNEKFWTLPNQKSLQTTILDLEKMVESSQKGYKILVTSNFSFSHSVFNRLLLQTHKNQGLFERGLTHYRTTKTKALADDKIKMTENLTFVLGRVENTVGKENVGYQHFLLFPQCFLKASFSGASKVGIM